MTDDRVFDKKVSRSNQGSPSDSSSKKIQFINSSRYGNNFVQ